MFKVNPYRAGAGLKPMFLAGRETDVEEITNMFATLKHNIPLQSVVYYGLRGVGKTVLMNEFYSIATKMDLFCEYIEIDGKKDFTTIIADSIHSFLQKAGIREKGQTLVKKASEALKSLVVSFCPEDNTFSLSLQEREFYTSYSYARSLTELLTSAGEVACDAGIPICYIIDEIQYMKKDELSALLTAIHRCNQLGLPVMIIGAGLPKIVKMLSDVKSYAERLFAYKPIGELNSQQAETAIVEPAKEVGAEFSPEAVRKVIEITKGYPFFIQQLCHIAYDKSDGKLVGISDVENNIDDFLQALDDGFFKSRYERCSDMEKTFIFSMVKCGELPCNIANIAKNMDKSVKSISPVRAKLIDKGVIYATRHGELDFTVPEFDGFVKRLGEYEEWTSSNG